ncbi:hypothetical protein [Phyllobacterium myrsinacearum]|uniref:Histidine phosphatase family protein n=1 Tax=Phyllobacterium myrsinacearum TaxID=28101 RepID=A0A839EPI8_9HYPH|nr:hypothetical protein [Phyllobacterium myrsinacearum]MBA8878387.1 hypothetical protein [Phyllobacterium myrsinacearum]
MAKPSTGTLTAIGLMMLTFAPIPAWSSSNVQTIAFIRHGEKPESGLGQLNCQGLNRALALPPVIAKTLGKPDFIFAPNPADQKKDGGELYDYIRPLATVEPTAISFGLPVNASIGVSDRKDLTKALSKPELRNARVLVAWEHKKIDNIVSDLLTANNGDATSVPKWSGDDFDSIYVVTITRNGEAAKATFEIKHEGLNGQSQTCPH